MWRLIRFSNVYESSHFFLEMSNHIAWHTQNWNTTLPMYNGGVGGWVWGGGCSLFSLKRVKWYFHKQNIRSAQISTFNPYMLNGVLYLNSLTLCIKTKTVESSKPKLHVRNSQERCIEPPRAKTYLLTCAHNEDSNQSVHQRNLTRVFVVRMKKLLFASLATKKRPDKILIRLRK